MIHNDMDTFHGRLKKLIHEYVRLIYALAKKFPFNELYGMTSQLRRATLSVMLNYIEGFARKRPAVKLNFFEISYGSFKESKYLILLAFEEGYISQHEYQKANLYAEEIGAMLWRTIEAIEQTDIQNR